MAGIKLVYIIVRSTFFFLINLERKFVHAIYVSVAIFNLDLTVMLKIDVSILSFLCFYLLAKL